MFYHTVHFWLREDLSDDQRRAFIAGCKKVADSENVNSCRVGLPAGTDRPVVDNSYDVQLHCVFESKDKHDAYQSDADRVHSDFIETFKTYWAKVVIYDSVEA
jgi:hypothetical protein